MKHGRMPPGHAGRLAAAGLAIATFLIVALAGLVLADLQREAQLHRDTLGAQQAKDSLQELRPPLHELRYASHWAAETGAAGELQRIEWRAVEIEAELDYLALALAEGAALPGFQAMSDAARLMVLQARSIAGARSAGGIENARAVAVEVDRLWSETHREHARALDAQNRRIHDRTLARIRIGESLRTYVLWLLGGAGLTLLGLFAGFRFAQGREAEALRNIERLALWDSVTGLPNRTFLADRLGEELSRAERHGRAFALLMFDLDGFKEVNDTHGHAAGDRMLAMMGARAARSMRASDVVARVGGDEVRGAAAKSDPLGRRRRRGETAGLARPTLRLRPQDGTAVGQHRDRLLPRAWPRPGNAAAFGRRGSLCRQARRKESGGSDGECGARAFEHRRTRRRRHPTSAGPRCTPTPPSCRSRTAWRRPGSSPHWGERRWRTP